jgi:hypothetical protein
VAHDHITRIFARSELLLGFNLFMQVFSLKTSDSVTIFL